MIHIANQAKALGFSQIKIANALDCLMGLCGDEMMDAFRIKRAMADSPNWQKLSDDQIEALEMIAHKAGRILNGDPDYHDSWHDIIGYTKLVADRLAQRQKGGEA